MGGGSSKNSNIRGKNIFRPISEDALQDLQKFYTFGKEQLGSGAFGKVFKGKSVTDPTFEVAIKLINKKNMSEKDFNKLGSEMQILHRLDHPNIVKYYEAYEDKTSVYLVMEL